MSSESATRGGSCPKNSDTGGVGAGAAGAGCPLSAVVASKPATPEELIAGFASGGNETVPANNALVDRLLQHGMAAVPALVAELKDPGKVRKWYCRSTSVEPREAEGCEGGTAAA